MAAVTLARFAAWNPVTTGCAAAALAGALVAYLAVDAHRQAPVVRRAYVKHYDGRVLTDPFEIMAVQSDGQAYAALARDPLLAHPEEFPSRAEAAYRAQRPLLGWLAWAASLGDSTRIPAALAALQVLAAGAAVWACWEDFTRPLLLAYAFGAAALLARSASSGRT